MMWAETVSMATLQKNRWMRAGKVMSRCGKRKYINYCCPEWIFIFKQ